MQKVDRHDRETFITTLLKSVPTATRADALRLLRWGRTYGRLCEAECNADWPYHDAIYDCTVQHCGQSFSAKPAADGRCPSCRAERIIRETCERMGELFGGRPPSSVEIKGQRVVPHFSGDPRWFTVRLQIAGAPLDPYDRPALRVPTS